MDKVRIDLVGDRQLAQKAAEFFSAQVEAVYISHGELMEDRALDTRTWAPDLTDIFATDALTAAANAAEPLADGLHLAAAFVDAALVGIMLYEFVSSRRSRYAQLHDIVVAAPLRGNGIGQAMVVWLEAEAARAGNIGKFFLESGLRNHAAHRFFERFGYATCSLTMLKSLRPAP